MSRESAQVGTITVLGVELELHADTEGAFWLRDDDNNRVGTGETLDAARAAARRYLNKRQVEVAVPFITEAGEHGIAKRRHATTRGIICEIDGRREELEANARVFRPDTPAATIERYNEITQEQRQLLVESREIERDYGLALGSRLNHELERAAEAAAETQEAAA